MRSSGLLLALLLSNGVTAAAGPPLPAAAVEPAPPSGATRASGAPTVSTTRATTVAPAGAPVAPRLQTIERVVAVVEGRPLFLTEVRALAAVRGLEFDPAREAAIDERLMVAEASRITQAEVSAEEEQAAAAALVARRPALLDEVPHPDLLRLVRRQMAILKYVEFRFRPQVRVSEDDVRKAWEAEEVGRPSGLALEDAQDAIRARLERRALDERIEAWIGELRSRASVRLVDPPPQR